MRVRRVVGSERARLQPWYVPYSSPYKRKLDAAEHGEVVHLYRTGQATREELAARFGVTLRTIHRYIREYPDRPVVSEAALRVLAEAERIGMRLLPAEAERLAAAALVERKAVAS